MRCVQQIGVAGILLLGASALAAPEASRCRIRAIHALKSGDGIDPKLESLKPLLKKAPFDQFKGFKLLEESLHEIETGKTIAVTLPNEKKLELTFLERTKLENRTVLRLKVTYPGLSTTYKVGEGDPIPLVLGQHKEGTLILAIDCASK